MAPSNPDQPQQPWTVHRIDLPCEKAGFSTPPFDVHIKFLPTGDGWTLLAHAAAGKPDRLASWLRTHAGIDHVRVPPGIAPKMLRAMATALPSAWAKVASYAKVHHLDLGPDGSASWYVEGPREQVHALVEELGLTAQPNLGSDVRCRPVQGADVVASLSRRQFETLSSAVALGYYDIPHRIDLRELAARAGISLGSVSELLRRAEASVLTQYVDAHRMRTQVAEPDASYPASMIDNLVRP